MSAEPIPFSTVQPPGGNDPGTREFVQALHKLLPPKFAEVREMSPEMRETLTETMWYQETTELFHLIAPAILGPTFLSEVLPIYSPMLRRLHLLAIANGRMSADNPMRRTWGMIGHIPTRKINTNGKKVAIQSDDAICWTSICAEVFNSSPQYVNKLTTEVTLLPLLPGETDEQGKEHQESSDTAAVVGASDDSTEAETITEEVLPKTVDSRTEKTVAAESGTAKEATTETEGQEPCPGTGVLLIPAPVFTKGDVEALYNFLVGNGASGLAPLDAVLGGLEEAEFQSKLSRFCNKIASAFFPNKLNVRVERLGED
jgi:hypothetical protein